jgi:hypothetical protein
MSQFRVRGLPPIKLQDLLRKRRTNLKEFLKNSGIATYTTLEQKCQKLGVSTPTEDEFTQALGPVVSSPQEGVIVLDPPTLVKDTGEKVDVDYFSAEEPAAAEASVEPAPKKKSSKKEIQ